MNIKGKLLTVFLLIIAGSFAYSIGRNHDLREIIEQRFLNERSSIEQEVKCSVPNDISIKDIGYSQFTIFWNDVNASSWEYYVQEEGIGLPSPSGSVKVTKKDNIVKNDNKGVVLKENTNYEIYVRSNCDNGNSDWAGPFFVKTLCKSFAVYPFLETFNSSSVTLDCWTTEGKNNSTNWATTGSSTFEGDGAMYFQGNDKPNDDWLISPGFTLDGSKIYELSYYYRTSTSNENKFEVLLSNNGRQTSEFKKVLVKSAVYKNSVYQKETVYITNYTGDVFIAWHVIGDGTNLLRIDNVSVEEVSCIAPHNLTITGVTKNTVDFSFEDDNNTSWEYHIQPGGIGTPIGSGRLTKKKENSDNQTSGTSSSKLQPNTEYEIYVRSQCGKDANSKWIGPIIFTTACNEEALPFWEGFNSSSDVSCWRILDNDLDGKQWGASSSVVFEGNRAFSFDVYGTGADDYLITPGFNFDASKTYKLQFHYRTSPNYKTDFEVLLSNSGTNVNNFNKKLLTKVGESSVSWKEEKIIVGGISGIVNFAWHVNGKSTNYLYLDNVFVEEVSCPDPTQLDVINIKDKQVDLKWEDDYGKNWEYVVQKLGSGKPAVNGVVTTNKTTTVDKLLDGNAIMPNTTYEYYVRTVCGKDDYSDWTGPYVFTTICSTFEVPYWEGFNSDTKSLDCWTIIDIDDDGDEYNGRWNIDSYRPFEGDGLISFTSYDGDQTDDWLISPSINFKAGKLYRLKYNYKSSANNTSSEFTVLASNSGLDIDKFTKEIVTKQKYTNSTYLEKTVFIDNYSGSVNFAWYVQGTDAKDFSIDNVFVEEVIGCPEPIDLNIDNIASESVEISWRDDFKASKWQYYIQKVGNSKPDNKTKGKEITSKINNKFSIDALGNKLEGNTDYEFYVRTDCGDGTFSIWTGPFNFTTLCGVYETPYWEGFNLDDLGYRCWDFQKYDGSKSYYAWNIYGGLAYEGSGSIRYYKVDDKNKPGEFPSDAWAISPAINLTPDTYVLKYNYLTDGKYDNEFEVRLSSTDRNPNSFTNILVPKATYTNSEYKENVVFFTGVASEVFVGWHATSEKTSYIYIDNITLKKVNGCQEPYYVVVENNKSDGFDLSWQQNGGITTWEVIVVKHGEDSNANPIVTKTVTGTPNTTINGLGSGELYTIYVRSKCSPAGDTFSDWSTSVNGFTKVGANDECSGAINIPVNESKECGEYVNATLFGATTSSTVLPSCNGAITNDIWFEFTAKTSVHSLSISDFTSLSSSTPTLEFAMYDKSCGAITNTALECFTLSSFDTSKVFKGLIPGQKYYFRIGVRKDKNIDVNFNLCITSPSFLNISESGNEYTVEELVKNVLVDSNCDLISNISWISGDQFKNDNSIGYFEQNSSDFVFNNGIVLSTNGVKYGMGPGDDFNEGNDTDEWVGDVDLESLLVANNRDPYSVNATVLEFDFIPIVDSLKFDFIFASNEYGSHQCDFSDVFAFFLTDLTSGEVINLAVVPGTDVPISVTTIKDMKYNRGCASSNVEYFDKFYGANGLPEYENPINYKGMTVPLTAKSAVIPGRKYHIKMAIADYMDNQVNSAVFLKGGSFNLGNLDLGEDLLVETGNALCSEEVRIIKSGLSFSDEFKMEISWYRDGILIPDSNQVDLEVKESGVYEIEVNYPELNCLSVGSIKIEMYPAISDEVYQAKPIVVCRQSIEDILVDLTSVEAEMFKDAIKESYSTSYYTSKEDAKLLKNEIADKENYSLGKNILNQSVYIRIENLITGCFEVFEVKIEAKQGEFPGQFENILVCSEYIFPELEENQHYFSESSGLGYEYLAGDALITPGEHTIYVLQINSDDGCYEETSYVVKITEKVVADVFPDLELDCEVHILQPLSKYNKYFTKAGGEGEELVVGSFITDSQMIYVYALSEDGVCFDESSYMVSYEECPIQKGISPNGDGINDSFDLSNHNVTSLKVYNRYGSEVYNSKGNYTNQWVGQNKEGNMLADGTYYYVAVSHGQIRTGWVQINR